MKVLFNGKIRTFDPKQPFVSAIAIEDGIIVAVGDSDTILASAPVNCEKQDLKGYCILPGFTDSHIHLLQYAQSRNKIRCETPSKEECLSRVTEKIGLAPPGKWILGHGWNQNLWGGQYGTREELDSISVIHPIYLTAKSLHAAWANTLALTAAGVNENTPDPPGGYFQRDARGKLTGIFFDNAIPLVEKAIPKPTTNEAAELLLQYQPEILGMGITSVHDFDDMICFKALEFLNKESRLKIRVAKSIPLLSLNEAIELGLRSGSGNGFLAIGSVKMFADGALGSKTAAMFEAYQNDPENFGLEVNNPCDLAESGFTATKNGLSVAIHAIGDRGNEIALQAFKLIRDFEKENALSHFKHRIEHAQLVQPNQLRSFLDFDLFASMQPLHATSDQEMACENWGERTRYSYAWKQFLDKGVHLIFGSDAPVESPNPFWGIYAAIIRKKHMRNATPFHPEQILTLTQALDAYITTPPKVIGKQDRLGRISTGFFADLAVYENDFLKMDEESLYNSKPVMMMVNGEWVWRS